MSKIESGNLAEKLDDQESQRSFDIDDPEARKGEEIEELDNNDQEKDIVIDDIKKEQIQSYANDLFTGIFDSNEEVCNLDPMFLENKIFSDILSIARGKKTRFDRFYYKELKDGMNIFFESLLNFYKQIKDEKQLKIFDNKIHKLFFAFSPNISDALNLSDHFSLTSKSTRDLKARNMLGASLSNGLTYKISFYNDSNEVNEILLDNILNSTVAEKLDKLNLIESLIADSIAVPQAYREGEYRLRDFIEEMKSKEKNAFILYYLDIVEKRADSEKENPSRGVTSVPGDPYNARLVDFISKEEKDESDKTERLVKFKDMPINGGKLFFISEDVVALFDHTNTPIKFSKLDPKIINEEPSPISTFEFNAIRKMLDFYIKNKTEMSEQKFYDIFSYINYKILTKYYKKDDFKFLAEKWAEFDPNISVDVWLEFFEVSNEVSKVQEQIDSVENKAQQKAWSLNENLSDECYKSFYENAPGIIKLLGGEQTFLKEHYELFKKYYDRKDYDNAHGMMDSFFLFLKYNFIDKEKTFLDKENNKDIIDLIDKHEHLQEKYISNFDKSRKDAEEQTNKLIEGARPIIEKENFIMPILIKDWEQIFSGFEKEFTKIKDDSTKNLQEVEFFEYSDFINQFKSVASEKTNSQEFGLLLQHFYRPQMRKYIEDKIGINFRDIPFRYQIYFLKFLSEKTKDDLDGVIDFLNKDIGGASDDKINKIKTFLSLEVDDKMGDTILDISKQLDNKGFESLLFSTYAQIIDGLDKKIDSIENDYNNIFKDKEFNRILFRKQLLGGAKDLLLNIDEVLHDKNNKQNNKKILELLNNFLVELETQSKNVVYFQEIINEIFENKIDFSREYEDTSEIQKKKTLFERLKERLDEMIFNPDTWKLPENFLSDIENQIITYKSEIENVDNKEVYLPVGISSDPSKKFNYKPIDAINYLFWLKNQGVKSKLIVVDTIQESNYNLLHGLNKQEASKASREVGHGDNLWYYGYTYAFDLENDIDVCEYESIKNSESFKSIKNYIENLCSNNKEFANIFAGLVEPSILRKAIENNPQLSKDEINQELINYPEEEVSMIISKNGLKISHEKERKYDVLSRIIEVYKLLEEHKDEITKIIQTYPGPEKYNPKNVVDTNLHFRNLSIYLSCLDSFSGEYKDLLDKLSSLEINREILIKDFTQLGDGIESKKQFIEDEDRKLKKDNLNKDDLINKDSFIENKIKGKKKSVQDMTLEYDKLYDEINKIEENIDQVKELIEDHLRRNNNDAETNVVLNKFKLSGFYKWNKEHILNVYSDIAQDIKNQDWFDDSKFSKFYYPKGITGMSFEIAKNKKDDKNGFKEFYSSYDSSDLSENANQIVAKEGWASSAKFFALSHEKQMEYFENVLKPLLINYFVAISNNKESAISEFREVSFKFHSMLDIILFIENTIVGYANIHIKNLEGDFHK